MIRIDLDGGWVEEESGTATARHALDSPAAFAVVSKAWLRCGWDNKHVYSFSWFGRPIIQLPEDMIRIQEVIYRIRPDVVIETGVAHGGSLIFYASLLKAMGMDRGRVIGIDVEIRPHNRAALEAHELYGALTLIEGSSIDPEIVARVHAAVPEGARVLVVLDSKHARDHVLGELRAYADLVSPGSYIVAADGIMGWLGEKASRAQPDWNWNNPETAAKAFLQERTDFADRPPAFPFNEGKVGTHVVTYWPGAWLQRISP
jgi:cephalosporin hydroxylase